MVKISRVRFGRDGPEAVLSPLESDIIRILWSKKEGKVRSIYNRLRTKRKMALTSVAVSLDRMYKMGLVNRRVETGRGGMHYIYSTPTSQAGFEKSIVDGVVNKLIDNFGNSAITYFNERFAKKKK